jgi:hypothetical protein
MAAVKSRHKGVWAGAVPCRSGRIPDNKQEHGCKVHQPNESGTRAQEARRGGGVWHRVCSDSADTPLVRVRAGFYEPFQKGDNPLKIGRTVPFLKRFVGTRFCASRRLRFENPPATSQEG